MTDSELPNPDLEHIPVLLHEAVGLIAPKPGRVYVDGTIGAGGHASEILKRSAPDGILIGLDQDAEAIERCRADLAPFGSRVILRQANYRDLPAVVAGAGFGSVDGVLLDLGVSCWRDRLICVWTGGCRRRQRTL
jgi:16S rRNA (cytosine1402-N4)-methyltransferase